MEDHTLRSRFDQLVQKSRKALRLYSSMARPSNPRSIDFSDMQVREWRDVNQELLKQLMYAWDNPGSRNLVSSIFAMRDRFYNEWRNAEAELHRRHKDLILASENGDFVRAASLSLELVSAKAKVEANQAAHHELQELIDQSRLHQPAIELSSEHVVEAVGGGMPEPRQAVVIPLHGIPRRARKA